MGNDMSLPKLRTVSPYDGSLSLRMQNNYHPLLFHQVHGDNIRLSKNKKVACRHEGFCKSIAFSDRPVLVYEPVCLKFVEISNNWSGALRIGFTMNDPTSMKSKLPRYACPDLTSINGNWAKAITERMAKKDSILFYYVDQNGDVHYGIDSEEHGIFFGGVNTSGKLWAVLDIYGNTTTVEFVDQASVLNCISELGSNVCNLALPPNHDNHSDNIENRLLSSSNMVFHSTHGKNVVLKKNRSVACRKESSSSLSYVFTERPLQINEKVLLKVIKTDPEANGSLIYGITSCNPSSILPHELPLNAEDLVDRLEYWVVRQDSNSYQINDIIAFSIHNDGEVLVMKNGKKSAIFHVDQTQRLWLFLNICGMVSEVFVIATSESYEADLSGRLSNLSVSLPSNTFCENGIPGTSSEDNFTERMCCVCFEELVNCAIYRCGHVCMCYNCAHKMWQPNSNAQCPMCREPIQDIIKIYA